MKNSEKQLVGIGMIAGSIYLVMSFAMPQLDTFNTNNTKSTSLKDELKSTEAQRDSLNLQISLLEKNIDIPANIQVKTFTNDTEEQAAKELLDHVVNLATGSGNKFISLNPATVEPFLAPPKPAAKDPNDPNAAGASPPPAAAAPPITPGATTEAPAVSSPDDEKAAALAKAQESLPPLVTKGYELNIRGTYNTLQAFLRAMDKQSLVMDMMNFELQNEAAGSTAGAAVTPGGSTIDPNFPLRLKVTLRLALQRIESIK